MQPKPAAVLKAGDWRCALRPEVGGALASLSLGDGDVLRPMAEEERDPLRSACFPLVPFANRVRDGRFAFGRREVSLPANFPPEPHALHGFGWQRPWTIAARTVSEARLMHEYDGRGEWPWAYRAEQQVSLSPSGCRVTLTLTNRSGEPMPAGLGLHPYFRRRPGARLTFTSGCVLLTGDDPLPSGETAPGDHFGRWSEGDNLPARLVDHCHADWHGNIRIDDELGTITMRAAGAPHLHVFIPPGRDDLCCEPVSHTPDALNRAPAGMTLVPPGCTAALEMWIEASAGAR